MRIKKSKRFVRNTLKDALYALKPGEAVRVGIERLPTCRSMVSLMRKENFPYALKVRPVKENMTVLVECYEKDG